MANKELNRPYEDSQTARHNLLLLSKGLDEADYQLIVPKKNLQKVLADKIKAFSEEKENDTKNNKENYVYAKKCAYYFQIYLFFLVLEVINIRTA